jgi:hypothetical protein
MLGGEGRTSTHVRIRIGRQGMPMWIRPIRIGINSKLMFFSPFFKKFLYAVQKAVL